MIKSTLEILQCAKLFPFKYFNKENSLKKLTFFAYGGISIKNCDACIFEKQNFKPKISPIFHFDQVNDG